VTIILKKTKVAEIEEEKKKDLEVLSKTGSIAREKRQKGKVARAAVQFQN